MLQCRSLKLFSWCQIQVCLKKRKLQIKISCVKSIKIILILSISSNKNIFFITYTIYTSAARTIFQLAYLYSYSYVMATSAYNTQYLNKFCHYYLFIPFIFNVAVYRRVRGEKRQLGRTLTNQTTRGLLFSLAF